MNNKILICSAATDNYIDYMVKLYKTLRIFHQDIYFQANLILEKNNKSNESYLKKFYNYKDDYLIVNVEKKKFKNNDHKRNYSSNCRIKYLHDNLLDYDMIFWMDADSIIRKPLYSLFEIDNKFKIIIHNYEKDYKLHSYGSKNLLRRQFKSGMIGFRKDKSSNFLIKNWYNILNLFEDEYWLWFEDQLMLGYIMKKVFNKYGFEIFYDLPKEYIDWDLNKNSYIWVGKGSKKVL